MFNGRPQPSRPSCRRVRGVRLLVPAGLLLGVGTGLGGCAAPDGSFVRSERATYEAIAPEYAGYVRADPLLGPEQKARRLRTVRTWDLSLRQHEQPSTEPQTQPVEDSWNP